MNYNEQLSSLRDELRIVTTNGNKAKDLTDFYRKIYDAEEVISDLAKEFSALKRLMSDKLLPEAFEREGTSTLKTVSGDSITIVPVLSASIPAEGKDEAHRWLEENGHSDLLKLSVNSQTLSSFVRAELAEGRGLPGELFKISTFSQARLKRGKGK